jgi:uncharacterized protein YbaP (TraB family)
VHGGPPPDIDAVAGDLDALASGQLINEITAAWYAADAGALQAMFDAEALRDGDRAHLERLLDVRNREMAVRIAELLAEPEQRHFVLVGAGHVIGDGSVIAELARMGFTAVQLGKDGEPHRQSPATPTPR